MGFAAVAELTHHMEDVFELLRQRTGSSAADAVNTVLACLDALSEAVDSIEESGKEQLDPEPLIEQLRRLVHSRTPEQELERAGGAQLPEDQEIEAAQTDGRRVLYLKADLSDDVLMPAVRAYMVFTALGDYGELLGSIPSKDGVEHFSGRVVEVWLASEVDEDVVARAAQTVSDIAAVTVREYGEHVSGAMDQFVEMPREAAATPITPAAEAQAAGEPAAAEAVVARHEEAPAATEIKPQQAAPPAHAKSASQNRSVRVDAERLDALMHLMGELVIHRTAVEARTASIESPELDHAMQNLTRSSQALQAMVMQVRMIPVDVVFMRFPRLVRDLSTKLGKEVELELLGRDTELDRTVVDALGDPLVHLVRNSLDHGLEDSATRLAHGKSATGTLTISARHAGGSVVIEVRDDGHGVDPAAVARKALSQGLIDADQAAEPRHARRARAAVRARILDGRDDQRRLRPRRRDGRGAHEDPGARRRGAARVDLRPGHPRSDQTSVDAGDRLRTADRHRRRAVCDSAGPGRTDAEARRGQRADGRRPAHARPRQRGDPAARGRCDI